MPSGTYDSIKQGLTEAIDFAHGKPSEARVHRVEVPQVDVAAGHPASVEGAAPATARCKCRWR